MPNGFFVHLSSSVNSLGDNLVKFLLNIIILVDIMWSIGKNVRLLTE